MSRHNSAHTPHADSLHSPDFRNRELLERTVCCSRASIHSVRHHALTPVYQSAPIYGQANLANIAFFRALRGCEQRALVTGE